MPGAKVPLPKMNPFSIAALLRNCSKVEALRRIKALDAPLSARLAAYIEWLDISRSDFAAAYDTYVERLSAAEVGARGPEPGDAFPSFVLPDQNGQLILLDRLLADGPLVISFNRGHWCPLCQIELHALNEARTSIESAGAGIVAIIPEPQLMARKLKSDNDIELMVLSDMDLAFAASLGLVVYLGEELRKLYLAKGIDVGAHQLTDGWFLPIPATFVVGIDGRIVARHIDPDFRRRMEVEAILEALRTCAKQSPSHENSHKPAKGG
jgi:peroxiredoxin